MIIKFITGNKNKFKEIEAVLSPIAIEQVDLDLDEIQELDPKKVIEHKIKQALKEVEGPLFVEDSTLSFECFDYKFPGTFLKWFQDVFNNDQLFELADKLGKYGAKGGVTIAFAKNLDEIFYFDAGHSGKIVKPRGDKDFGYGSIFEIEGSNKTFGEMEREEKHKYSARGIAANKLKQFLLKQHE